MLNENAPHQAERRHRGAKAEVLVRMQEDGDKPPLYFLPVGYGDIRAFRKVVALLDDDQPVYGLQPPGPILSRDSATSRSSGSFSVYIAEIKWVQPELR